jgi:hypothetical protein
MLIVGLLAAALATSHHDGSPGTAGWACLAVLVAGALWYARDI